MCALSSGTERVEYGRSDDYIHRRISCDRRRRRVQCALLAYTCPALLLCGTVRRPREEWEEGSYEEKQVWEIFLFRLLQPWTRRRGK